MLKTKYKSLPKSIRTWLPAWIIIYLLIISLDLLMPAPNDLLTIIKLSGIILCFIYVVYASPRDHLLLIAMFTTSIADLILAANNTSELGIIIFFAVQIIHLFRLSTKQLRLPIILYIATVTIIIILDLIFSFFPLIFLTTFFYVATLLGNIAKSWDWRRIEPHNYHAWCALLGFILFLCCDICTGISFMALNRAFPAFLYAPANYFAWFFYYPSQILVSNSSKCATIEAKEG